MSAKKILHQHLIKCGGTSLNVFLDSNYYAGRVHNPETERIRNDAARENYRRIYGNTLKFPVVNVHYQLDHFDCVHGHNPMLWYASDQFAKITVLRDPIERVISQIRDWKRLKEHDLNHLLSANNDFLRMCKEASLTEIIQRFEEAPIGINNLSNMQSKLLYKSFFGTDASLPEKDNELLAGAQHALQQFDVYGLIEDMPDFYARLCRHMGWCPPRAIEHGNRTSSQSLAVTEKDVELLRKINSVDIDLYDFAKEKLAGLPCQSVYDTDTFEGEFASERVKDLAPIYIGNKTFRFDFNMPIVGNGFHGRDAANTPEAAVWTGPGCITTLFFPVLPLTSMVVQLGIKGYVDEVLRGKVRFWIDGAEKPFIANKDSGLADLLEFEHCPERSFVRLDIEVPNTFVTSCDTRRRGLSLLFYGYRLCCV